MRLLNIFLFGVIFVFCCNFVLGSGVVPSSYRIDFKPNLEGEYVFNFLLDGNQNVDAYVTGDLSQYFSIKSNRIVFGRRQVIVTMKLPEGVEVPGLHRVSVGLEIELENKKGVSLITNALGSIFVRVPYPDKYAELEFGVDYVNYGEKIPYELLVESMGVEDITVQSRLVISNNEGVIKTIPLGIRQIKSLKNTLYEGLIESKDLFPGDYNITAYVNYGGEQEAVINNLLRIGELRLEISNYSQELEANKVNSFNLEVESFWNEKIDDVFVNGTIIGYPVISFKSPSASVNSWGRVDFVSYFDTSLIEEEYIQALVQINYDDKVTEEVLNLRIVPETNWTLIIFISVGVLTVILISVLIFFLLRKNNGK